MMKTLLVTGGIGSGKSVVCTILAEKGIPVYDTDSRAKQLYYTDGSLVSQIENHFGIRLFGPDGQLDRKTLSDLIFSDPKQLEQLEAFVHPALLRDFIGWRNQQDEGHVPFVCMESAIVLDKPVFKDMYDAVLVVDAPVELRLERAARRDAAPKEKILERIRRQNVHRDRADVVIENEGTLETLQKKVEEALDILNL